MRPILPRLAASLLLAWGAAAHAQALQSDLVGEYALASSTTAPRNDWGYSKGRISIRALDEQHVLVLLACEWKREPKAACGDYFFAQRREGDVYIQDMNTDTLRFYFDPRARTLTVISRGFDAKESVRRDVFAPTDAAPTDPVLVRRLKREQGNADSKENLRVFGHYSKWTYQNNRIEFQH